MPQRIAIKASGVNFEAELNESVTDKAIYGALPIRAKGQRWGCCKRVEEKVCKRLEKCSVPLYPLHEGLSMFLHCIGVIKA